MNDYGATCAFVAWLGPAISESRNSIPDSNLCQMSARRLPSPAANFPPGFNSTIMDQRYSIIYIISRSVDKFQTCGSVLKSSKYSRPRIFGLMSASYSGQWLRASQAYPSHPIIYFERIMLGFQSILRANLHDGKIPIAQ